MREDATKPNHRRGGIKKKNRLGSYPCSMTQNNSGEVKRMRKYEQLSLWADEPIEHSHHKTIRCQHIKYSWQQRDGKIFIEDKRIHQLCAECVKKIESGKKS